MNLLCKIGWHKWRQIDGTFGTMMYPVPIEVCQKCELLRKWFTPEHAVTWRDDATKEKP